MTSGNGGPNHQRMGDRARHPVGVGLVEGSDDMHGDQARYTLLVRRYATREAAAHLFQGLGELAKRLGALANGLSRLRAIAAGKQEAAIVRGRAGIDNHLVEACGSRLLKRPVCQRRRKRRVSGQHQQHLGAFRHAAYGERAAPVRSIGAAVRNGSFLRVRAGGQDGARRIVAAVARRPPARKRNTALERLDGRARAHDSRGSHQHLVFPATQLSRREACRAPRHLEAVLAGQRVGVARVDQHGTHESERDAAKMVPRHVHRRGAERVAREQRRAGAGYVSRHQRAVEAVVTLVEARMHARSREAEGGSHASLVDRRKARHLRMPHRPRPSHLLRSFRTLE